MFNHPSDDRKAGGDTGSQSFLQRRLEGPQEVLNGLDGAFGFATRSTLSNSARSQPAQVQNQKSLDQVDRPCAQCA